MAALALVLNVCVLVFGKIELSFVVSTLFAFSRVFLLCLLLLVVLFSLHIVWFLVYFLFINV